jgi:dihydrofolate reductase
MSRELILNMSISLDGFVAGSNGEFDWVFRNSIPESRQWAVEQLAPVSLHVMGSRSYQGMADYWPTAEGPFAPPMNNTPKAVFSRSGKVATPAMEKTIAAVKEGAVDPAVLDSWMNPIVAGTDLAADIQRLKAEDGGPINALGGASFASSLIAAQLVDIFRLVVHPVALGQGIPIFTELDKPLYLKLEGLKQFESGVVVKTFRPIYSD